MKTCLLSLVLMLTCAFAHSTAQVKQAALEGALAVLTRPIDGYPPRFVKAGCSLKEKKLHAGKPVFVRSLVHPTAQDRQRLRQRIREARAKDPDFVTSTESGSYDPYKDYYRVSVFDRVCGYLFHTELEAKSLAFGSITGPLSLTRQEAQRRLASAVPPTLVRLTSLDYLGYMWLAGSKAVEVTAYGIHGEHTVYRVVERSGKPVAPLKTNLELFVLKRPFTLTDGTPSAFWDFRLPVRLEPLPKTNPR